jgi:hypothetical protein
MSVEKQTRADRLNALKAAVGPHATHVIQEITGGWRVTIDDPDTGDRLGAVGKTLDAALDALTGKVAKRT